MKESVKKYLENEERENDKEAAIIDGMPSRFFERFIMQGLRIDLIELGRLICSIKVPSRLLNAGKFLHCGATAVLVDMVGAGAIYAFGFPSSGFSVEINISYLDAAYADEEIEIEAKVLRVGKVVGVVSVELRKKETGKIIAQGRLTKYVAVSKM